MEDGQVVTVTDRTMNVTDFYTEVYEGLNTELSNGTLETTSLWLRDEMISAGVNDTSGAVKMGWLFQPIVFSASNIIQVILAIVGIVGNTLVLLATSRGKTNMRSTDILVRSLAVADLLTSILIIPYPYALSLPNTISGELYCKVIGSLIFMWTSVVASVFTLTTISIERYIAISHPFFHRRAVTKGRLRAAIVSIWILAFLLNINPLFVQYVDDGTSHCLFMYYHRALVGKNIYGGIVLLVELIAPSAIMLTTYMLASRTLNHELARFKTQTASNACGPCANLIAAKKRNMNSLLIVFLTFVVCWGPHQFMFLLFNFGVIDLHLLVDTALYQGTVLLAFCNSCANPLIYTIRFPKFRSMLIAMVKCCTVGKSRESRAARVDIFATDMISSSTSMDSQSNDKV